MSTATATSTPASSAGWFEWLSRELKPSPGRGATALRLVLGVVVVTIASMTLEIPEVALSAYMVFFVTKENRARTVLAGVVLTIGATIGIAVSMALLKVTIDFPALRIVTMAAAVFVGMFLSRVFVVGPLGFAIGFVLAVSQSFVDRALGPEFAVHALLWLWVVILYPIAVTVVINRVVFPDVPAVAIRKNPAAPVAGKKRLLTADAFTNPAHVRFGFKVALAAMTCYFIYTGVDWPGIHTAFITCCIIALESTSATLRKARLRLCGCFIGGSLGFISILYLVPHMETIVSLTLLVAAVSTLAGWGAAGSQNIAYAGLQIAFAFYLAIFQSFAPATDLDVIRDRVAGVVLGIVVTSVVFRYLWPERESTAAPN